MKSIVILIALALLSGCVTDGASSYTPSTPSGKPEVTIKAPVGAIKSALISRAMNQGFNVTKDTDYILQVEKPTQNFGAAVLLGSKYDSTPNERFVFTFAQMNDGIRVVASTMYVTNPGSAFEQLTPINAGQGIQQTENSLNEIKSQLESASRAAAVGEKAMKKKK